MGLTSIFVTHDQEEAFDLADRVAIMNKGQIEQAGTSEEIYKTPANAFIYDFLGGANKFECEITDGVARFPGFTATRPDLSGFEGRATAYVRAEDLEIVPTGGEGIAATVLETFRAGAAPRVELRLDDGSFVEALLHGDETAPLDHGARVALRPKTFRVFAEN